MISHVDAVDGVVDERLAMIALAFWLDRSHWRHCHVLPYSSQAVNIGEQLYSNRAREGRDKSRMPKSFSRGQTISLRKYKNQKTFDAGSPQATNWNNVVLVMFLDVCCFLVFVFSKTDCLTTAERLWHSWLIATLPRPVWIFFVALVSTAWLEYGITWQHRQWGDCNQNASAIIAS